MAAPAARAQRSYLQVLRSNPQFALVFAGEAVSQAGNWFAYMAQVALVQRFSGGSSRAVAALVLVRLAPPLVFAAPLGALASGDLQSQRRCLVLCSLCSGGCSALMCGCRDARWLPLLFVLLFVQAAAVALYDPLRRAMEPSLVPPDKLQEAATLDGLTWSLTLSAGAAAGGFAVAALGTDACLLLDAATFVASACIWARLAPPSGGDGVVEHARHGGEAHHAHHRGGAAHGHFGGGLLRDLGACLARDPPLAAFAGLKTAGAAAWGAADVLAARYAALPALQAAGGASVTLGLTYAAVGVGCVVGPLVADAVTPQRQRPLLQACAAALAVIGTSYAFLAAAPVAGRAGFALLLGGTAFRNLGSNTLWIYSTLLLQLRAPPRMLGRLFALEQAAQTAANAAVAAAYGAGADAGAPLPLLALACGALGVAEAVLLACYAASRRDVDAQAGQGEGEELLDGTAERGGTQSEGAGTGDRDFGAAALGAGAVEAPPAPS